MAKPSLKDIRCPKELADLPGWLCWRFEKNGDKKPLKVPLYVSGSRRYGDNGSLEDRKQLATFSIAKQKAIEKGYEGIGLALMPEFNITVLDFDNCNVTDQDILSLFGESYAEISPSGKGLHAFLLGSLPNRKSTTTQDSFGFEVFSTKGFVTFTGNKLLHAGKDIKNIPETLTDYYEKRFGRSANDDHLNAPPPGAKASPLGVTEDFIRQALSALPDSVSYDEWVQIGMALHHETAGEGFELWDEWSAQSPKYSSSEYGLARWQSFGRSSGRPVTLRWLVQFANQFTRPGNKITLPNTVQFDKIETPKDAAPDGGYYRIISDLEYTQQVKPVNWLIKGFLPKATLGILYGESGSGKSFIALDLCGSLARGLDWHVLRRSKSAATPRILYIAAEGSSGIALRLAAYRHQSGLGANAIGFDLIHDITPNLTSPSDVTNLIADIEARGLYDLIVVDTFAQSTPGANENSAEDMGLALNLCKQISIASNAMVLLVHHSGKDASKGARGWSGLFAAADAVFEVKRTDNVRTLTVKKQKDGNDGQQYDFGLLPVLLGQDEDGEDITSCVVGDFAPHQEKKEQKEDEEDLI